ncbi:MAG: DUF763 domain-containing protein [Candidatus Bathyarchaeota archaeon]|nr:DUF763 domain-containing protein [Candidatus Bathyarchaeota archaeon]
MKRTGVAELPLHGGRTPSWLFRRMVKLGRSISEVLIQEFGHKEFLRRVSDPFWFQALSCVLGYDFHSSGTTTVTCGALKIALNPEDHGIAVCGGKGKTSLRALTEISQVGDKFSLSTKKINSLKYASRMSVKVDNAAIQAGYPLYHHAFILTEHGDWCVVQQGLDPKSCYARRYHWLSEHVNNFVVEPHDAIVGDVKRDVVLDMTAEESEGCRKTSTAIAKEKPRKVVSMLKSVRPAYQESLKKWVPNAQWKEYVVDFLFLPKNLNWNAIKRAYDFKPKNYEELLGIRGVGPATVRALALISELLYGEKPSWKDPVKYSFCVGGKDGVPYPVDRTTYDEAIDILENAVKQAKIGDKERTTALKRLSTFMTKL